MVKLFQGVYYVYFCSFFLIFYPYLWVLVISLYAGAHLCSLLGPLAPDDLILIRFELQAIYRVFLPPKVLFSHLCLIHDNLSIMSPHLFKLWVKQNTL